MLAALSALVRPGKVPEPLRVKLLQTLAKCPLRLDGVWATLEFVFAVHPSGDTGPHKSGGQITSKALALAMRTIATPAASVPPDEWFSVVSPQLLALLDGQRGSPDLVKAAAYIISFGILGQRKTGAPGTFVISPRTLVTGALALTKGAARNARLAVSCHADRRNHLPKPDHSHGYIRKRYGFGRNRHR